MSVIFPYPTTTAPFTQRGSGFPQLQRVTLRYSPTNGFTSDSDIKGLDGNLMNALASYYENSGCEAELTSQGGMWSLKVTDTTGNITIDTWEISAGQEMVSWLKNPFLLANLESVAGVYTSSSDPNVLSFNIQRFQKVLALGIDNRQEPFNIPLPTGNITTDTAAANSGATPPVVVTTQGVFSSKNFFDGKFSFASISPDVYLPIFRSYQQALEGSDSYFSNQYTIRHTTSASNRGYFNVADTNVDAIYSSAQFFSETTDLGFWVFPMPPELIGAVNAIFTGLGAPPANYLQGALKGGSSRSTSANNRVNITTEYKIFNWSVDRYATV